MAPRALSRVKRTLLAALVAFGALGGSAAAEECVTIEDFAKGKVGEFPPDWKPRKESGRPVYSIQMTAPYPCTPSSRTRPSR